MLALVLFISCLGFANAIFFTCPTVTAATVENLQSVLGLYWAYCFNPTASVVQLGGTCVTAKYYICDSVTEGKEGFCLTNTDLLLSKINYSVDGYCVRKNATSTKAELDCYIKLPLIGTYQKGTLTIIAFIEAGKGKGGNVILLYSCVSGVKSVWVLCSDKDVEYKDALDALLAPYFEQLYKEAGVKSTDCIRQNNTACAAP